MSHRHLRFAIEVLAFVALAVIAHSAFGSSAATAVDFPDSVERFSLVETAPMETVEGGVVARYGDDRRRHRAALVYVYPVREPFVDMPHRTLVEQSMRGTMTAVSESVGGVRLHDAAHRTDESGRMLMRVRGTYRAGPLHMLLLLYQSERDGKFVTVRITAPDNPANRQSGEWDAFAARAAEAALEPQEPSDGS